ncbi:MAG: glycosyltransferase family 4 protein [Burkholderiaceae bacterium]|nr:glycosyltransferase family 4 protein [Burkholderiaceae bacterium]
MLKQIAFAIPGDIYAPTGGYIYDRHIMKGLVSLGWQVELVGLGEGFPFPDDETLCQAYAKLDALPAGMPVVVDGLAFGVMPDIATAITTQRPVIALVHHPLAFEAGLSPAQAARFKQTEKQALAYASQIIVTSPATARDLTKHFEVSPERIRAVIPGTDRAALAMGSQSDVVALLSVGSIIPRKGFDVLLPALNQIKDLHWHLTIAGDRSRNIEASQQLDQDIQRFGFSDRISILGAVSVETLANLYASADVFVLASRFEGFGMAYAEALAHGLPVVGTTGGAIPDTVPADAGLLVEPGNVAVLALALKKIIESRDLRHQLGMGARRIALDQPTWADSAQRFSELLLKSIASL